MKSSIDYLSKSFKGLFLDKSKKDTTAPHVAAKDSFKRPDPYTYRLSQAVEYLDRVFTDLRRDIYERIDQRKTEVPAAQSIYREYGKLSASRGYFYIKPFNKFGWLFEQNGVGWSVSMAEKVASQDLFVRKGQVWDLVSVLEPVEATYAPRLSSQRLSAEYLPVGVYGERFFEQCILNLNKA